MGPCLSPRSSISVSPSLRLLSAPRLDFPGSQIGRLLLLPDCTLSLPPSSGAALLRLGATQAARTRPLHATVVAKDDPAVILQVSNQWRLCTRPGSHNQYQAFSLGPSCDGQRPFRGKEQTLGPVVSVFGVASLNSLDSLDLPSTSGAAARHLTARKDHQGRLDIHYPAFVRTRPSTPNRDGVHQQLYCWLPATWPRVPAAGSDPAALAAIPRIHLSNRSSIPSTFEGRLGKAWI